MGRRSSYGPEASHPLNAEWMASYAADRLAESLRVWAKLVDAPERMAGVPERAAMRLAFPINSCCEHSFFKMSLHQEACPV